MMLATLHELGGQGPQSRSLTSCSVFDDCLRKAAAIVSKTSVMFRMGQNACKIMLSYIGIANIVGVSGWSSGEER